MSNTDDTKKLLKALQKKSSTSDNLEPWQELLERNQSISATKALQASEVIQGFSGSWASLFDYSPYTKIGNRQSDGPTPKRKSNTRIGQPGLPEINFPPFDFYTNRGGNKGPALLGHPISFSVVGPSAKSPYNNWQWSITDNSGTANGDVVSLDLSVDDGSAIIDFVADYYGVSSIPEGGLYLLFSVLGDGDGEFDTTGGRAPITPLSAYQDLASFELFRVIEIDEGDLRLDTTKRIADYFNIPATPGVRAITLIKPRAARLVPIPNGVAGTETTFVAVPPETSLNTDLYPPFAAATGSWLDGSFNPQGAPGIADSYGGEFAQPLVIPSSTDAGDSFIFQGELENVATDGAPNSETGLWRIHRVSGLTSGFTANDIGKVIRVTKAEIDSTSATEGEAISTGKLQSLLGWFEIQNVGNSGTFGDFLVLHRVPEVNPDNGEVFFGPGPWDLDIGVNVEFTIHDSVSSLFSSNELDLEALASTRLTNLIDPSWVERTTKKTGIPGSSPARADRAIFDTSSSGSGFGVSANPGSLLDLGFRMVLFPAKDDGGGNPIPDFDNPINSREVTIDPSVTDEKQYLEVDYSAGLVRLSHSPAVGGDILPNGIITGGGSNPNGRVALFASFVPYSMEKGQTGGLRITGGDSAASQTGPSNALQTDLWSQRRVLDIVAGHSITAANNVIDLEGLVGDVLPSTGVVEIIDGVDIFQTPLGTFNYRGKTTYPTNGEPAEATVSCGFVSAGDTLTIGGQTLTAVAGARTPGSDDFQASVGSTLATELASAINDPANSFSDIVTATVSSIQNVIVVLTAVPIGAEGNTIGLSTTSGGFTLSGANLAGGVTTETATRLTGVSTSLSLPQTISDGLLVLRREPEAPFELDTTYGSAARSDAIRFASANLESAPDGSILINGGSGPATELRAPEPLGIDPQTGEPRDIARISLDDGEQKWEISSPPYVSDSEHDVGLKVTRGQVSVSTSYELSSGDFEFQTFRNRGALIRERFNSLESKGTFDIVVDKGVTTGLVSATDGFFDFTPDVTTLSEGGICAVVEGQTVITEEKSQWASGGGNLTVNTRFVINIREFGDKATRDASAENLLLSEEASRNPVNWLAYTATGSETSVDIASVINSHYAPAAPAQGTNNRVEITERQVEILPSKPYIQSRDVTGSVTFVDPCYLTMTIRSADPGSAVRDRWVTLRTELTKGSNFTSSDADTIAAFLNDAFYGTGGHPNPVDGDLDAAGFYQTDHFSVASPNPDLASATVGERQFLFAGPNDPRHPDGSNSVVLLCGGWGSSVSGGTTQDFFNVMLEMHVGDDLGGGNSALTVLGNEFTDFTHRCGLFFGNDAGDNNTGGFTPPVSGDFNTEVTEANANEELGFARKGLLALPVLGSFPITGVQDTVADTTLTVEIPRGWSQYYTGVQKTNEKPLALSDWATNQEPWQAESSARTNPYLGRWQENFERVEALTNNASTSAGISHIWIGYSTHSHDDSGFTSYLTESNQRGYQSFLVYGVSASDGLAPKWATGAIRKGDLVLAHEPSGPRDGKERAFEGWIFDPSPEATTVGSTSSDRNLMIMAFAGRGYSANTDHIQAQSIQPSEITPPLTNNTLTGFTVSVVANPDSTTFSSALELLYSNLSGPSTFADDGTVIGPLDGSGLDGGSTTQVELPQSSATIASGGRIGLISTIGPNAPAGVSFSTPVLGSENPDGTPSIRFQSTFLEQGVFTTSVSLSKAGFGSGVESAGVYDAFRASQTTDQGQFGGHQAGGVAGLRVSGDAQVWLTNLRALTSDETSAIVRKLGGFNSQNIKHAPSLGLLGAEPGGNLKQEAIVSIALTRSDWTAFQAAVGNSVWPLISSSVYSDEYDASQAARDGGVPMAVPFLNGCYLDLGAPNFDVVDSANNSNQGTWRIVGSPILTASASFASDSPVSLAEFFPYSPVNPFIGIGGNSSLPPGITIAGHAPTSTLAGYIQLRVERVAQAPENTATSSFYAQSATKITDGHPWSIYYDSGATKPVYVADVVDPGGSPTGSPSSLSGLSLDPSVLNSQGDLPMDIVSVFTDTNASEEFSFTGRGRLLGIHENPDSKGRMQSVAYFAMDETGTPTTGLSQKAYARMAIYSAQRNDRLDESTQTHTQGEFQRDSAGRVQFVGHSPRLGPGILMDGGLGMVQANAFRSNPRGPVTSTVGSLVIWGQDAADPLPNYSGRSNRTGVDLPSTFNKAEVHDTLAIVAPNATLSIENARAARGLPFVLRENQISASSFLSPLHLAILRNTSSNPASPPDIQNVRTTPNDALFPYSTSGIKIKTPGTVVYERAFRSIDATGGNAALSSLRGKPAEGGIKGLEIPVHGEVLLLPKGPPTTRGAQAKADFTNAVTGVTPLDNPLYEFVNGPSQGGVASPVFSIDPTPIFDALPVGASPSAGNNVHRSSPGSLSQAYRHSKSREVGTTFGYDGISDSFSNLIEQMRLLDGMVLEDIDNGTFYTVGDVGRWKTYLDSSSNNTSVTASLSQPGVGDRSSVNGSLVVGAGRHQTANIEVTSTPSPGDTVTVNGVTLVADTDFTISGTTGTAFNLAQAINANVPRVLAEEPSGVDQFDLIDRRVGYRGSADNIDLSTSNGTAFSLSGAIFDFGAAANPEIIYDIGEHCDPLTDMRLDADNGFGDRVDGGKVRRPLSGHRFRITPNVEFVPVLGPRGVDGGLLPPLDGSGSEIPDADAIFYSIGTETDITVAYDFKSTDIGRFLYICGTDNYVYTGWWVIIDTIPNYEVVYSTVTRTVNVAVLRKWKRDSQGRDGDSSTQDGALPLQLRAPKLRMVADRQYNDVMATSSGANAMFSSVAGNYSDLTLEVTNSSGSIIYSVVVPQGDLSSGGVVDCDTLATFCNGDSRTNGNDVTIPGGPVSGWITWTAVSGNLYAEGVTVEVTYDLSLLDDAQKAEVLGEEATLRIQFLSTTDSIISTPYTRNHNVVDGDLSIGFYSFKGCNSQIDRAAGDRNNAAKITSPSNNNQNLAGTHYTAFSAAQGLRWVFSSPLTEEQVGSYVTLTKPSTYRFGVQLSSQDDSGFGGASPDDQAWTSGWPRLGDELLPTTNIYRINRCPNTGSILLGGDCEVFQPEINQTNAGSGDQGRGRPILYSPLSILGRWPDSETAELPSTGSVHFPYSYSLQPIARERIVSVSPRQGKSNVLMGHSGDNPGAAGPDGLAPAVSIVDVSSPTDPRETIPLSIAEPWVLMNRQNATRTRVGEQRVLSDGWYADQFGTDFGSQEELFNSNNPQPSTSGTAVLADSTYSWTPAGEWWQMFFPKAIRDSWLYDASVPPPTLRIDLTETFTQAMQPGSGVNSPYPGKAPKGARLNRLWVNFGVWGNDLASRDKDDAPGYNPGLSYESEVLEEYYMCFNLVLEIPGSQARQMPSAGEHPLNAGTAGLPFGDRAPSAAYNHPDNSSSERYPGGTIVVPLYVNREAGDVMPNVMERFVTAGPVPTYNSDAGGTNPETDWVLGDFEYGFGCSNDGVGGNFFELYSQETFSANSHNPIVWGGIDTALDANGGPFTAPGYSRALGSPFPRSSRMGGGVRSAFTSGIVPDGDVFKRINADSLSSYTLTGITVTHGSKLPAPQLDTAGSFRAVGGSPVKHAGRSAGHAFTVALTPVGDFFETPKDGGGNRIAVDPTVTPSSGSEELALLGRVMNDPLTLGFSNQPNDRPFKVGNWLDHILDRYGIASPSGSMLPPGARVYLEVTAGPGEAGVPENLVPGNTKSATGCWVGNVYASFEVETADGTAYSTNVNVLGEDGS